MSSILMHINGGNCCIYVTMLSLMCGCECL